MQAYFLGDVGVIGCNSLGDSYFQTYVMNNVEIVIDYYLLITSHVSHAFTSFTHFTCYSLLSIWNSVWICFGHPRLCFLWCLMQNMFKFWKNLCFWWLKPLFWSFGLKTHVSDKLLNSFSCISFMKLFWLSVFCINFCNFSKKNQFSKISIDWICFSTDQKSLDF